MNKKTIRFGTLCSGIGAPEFALKNLGVNHKLIFACDFDNHVKETFLLNHNCDVFYDNVNNVENPPKTDLMVVGFPCQPYSVAGKKKGFLDIRGKLILKVIEVIGESNPDYFIAENVEGLMRIDEGKTLKFIIDRFEKMGYFVTYSLLNSIDFGIPQNRNRLWIVGSKFKKFVFPNNKINCPSLRDFLDLNVTENVYATKKFLSKEKVINRMENYGNDYINCITQTISRNGSSGEYISYVAAVNKAINQKRKPTVTECRRLFGFPDNFIFPESVSNCRRYNMFANSMVVPVLEKIIERIIK